MAFKLTPKQEAANRLLGSDARHCMLYGGSRSGKTFLIMRAIVTRALARPSRHAVLRFRFNHVKTSIIHDTLPKVMDICFPGVGEHCRLDKSDWFYEFPNGSQIWFGGLDDKERTEKILGSEFATIFLNECSQIPWASRNMAMTRLAQKVDGLRLKAYYDCNPPSEGHWTHKLFVTKIHPDTRGPLKDPMNYGALQVNPADNQGNLPPEYIKELEALPERMRRRFLLGQFGSAAEAALWTLELLDQSRFSGAELPSMQRILVAVDPSGCSGPEDVRSDEVGIVVCGIGQDGKGYVLEDLSGKFGPGSETGWGNIVVSAFDRYHADCVVAETNYGGAMVGQVIKAAANATERISRLPVPFREVKASRGKAVRAEPIATLFEQQKVVLAGTFPHLEDQLCGMTTGGYVGDKSPDRADAMVWGLTSLFPGIARKPEGEFGGRMPRVILGHQKLKTKLHVGGR
jgi:phage terminase large subunit-like protein